MKEGIKGKIKEDLATGPHSRVATISWNRSMASQVMYMFLEASEFATLFPVNDNLLLLECRSTVRTEASIN